MAWSMETLYQKIQSVITSKKSKIGREEYRMYVLMPYLASLGYDVYNFNEVELDSRNNKIILMNKLDNEEDEIKITVSMDNLQIPQTFLKDGTHIHLVINIVEHNFTLYTLALDQWEKLYEVDITKVNDDDSLNNYVSMVRYLSKDSVQSEYESKGSRIFTEGAVNKLLAKRDFNNRFIREILRSEIEKPSHEFIALIVARLTTKYTTSSADELFQILLELQDTGLVGIIDSAIGLNSSKGNHLDKDNENIDNKENKLNELLKTVEPIQEPVQVEDKPIEVPVEEPVQEEPVVEEEPIVEEPVQEEPVVEEEPVQEEPIEEEPVQEEPIEEEPVQEERGEIDLGDLMGNNETDEEDVEEEESTMSLGDLLILNKEEEEEEEEEMDLSDLLGKNNVTKKPIEPPKINMGTVLVETISNEDEDDSDNYDSYYEGNGGHGNLDNLEEVVIGQPLSVDSVNENIKHKKMVNIQDAPTKRRMNTRGTNNSRLEELKRSMEEED